jgi:hypothetical protein
MTDRLRDPKEPLALETYHPTDLITDAFHHIAVRLRLGDEDPTMTAEQLESARAWVRECSLEDRELAFSKLTQVTQGILEEHGVTAENV